MAILKDLIVHGSSRFLNKIYANEIQAEEGIFSKLIAKNADITDLTVYGLLDSRGQLHTKTWTNSNIATIDGSFYITPTLNSASGTFSFLNSTSTNARFIGDFSVMNSSSMYLGGKSPTTSSWTANSKILITGQVKVNNEWIPLGNVVADISSVNSTTLDIKNIRTTINGNTAPSTTSMIYFVKPNQTLSYRNLKISLCEIYRNSASNPLGIYITSSGLNGKTFLDIYGGVEATNTAGNSGGLAKPNVRIGNLSGIPSFTISGGDTVSPSGWGIFTTNGYFEGAIVSNVGNIGGWNIRADGIYNGIKGITTSGTTTGTFIGIGGISNYQDSFTYVNIQEGVITAKGANISGSILATSFSAYDSNNKERATVNTNGLIVKDASGNTVASLSNNLTIGQVAAGKYNVYVDATNGIDIRNNTASLANFSSSVRIGKTGQTRAEIDFHSLQLKDKEGDPYLYVSDLRNASGVAENVQESFTGIGTTKQFKLFGGSGIQSISSVAIDGTATSAYTYDNSGQIVFNSVPANGAKIVVTYTTTSPRAKVYTLGQRSTDIDVKGLYSYAEGYLVTASGIISHAEGYSTTASGRRSHAEGWDATASGETSHAEGYNTTASGGGSHAEGNNTTASGSISHAEGNGAKASGYVSHAEGSGTTASGDSSHAEGLHTTASGGGSHAEGNSTTASGSISHAEGLYTTASGYASHAQNRYTKAASSDQTAIGKYNIEDGNGIYAFIIGNGSADNNRSNALTVDWSGNLIASGSITDGTGNVLSAKADTTTVNTALATKADTTTVNTALATKVDMTIPNINLDTTAASGTMDGDLYTAITTLGWESEVLE